MNLSLIRSVASHRWYSHFSSYVDLDPASTVYPQKHQEYQAPQKTLEILATQILCLDLRKKTKMHRNDPKSKGC